MGQFPVSPSIESNRKGFSDCHNFGFPAIGLMQAPLAAGLMFLDFLSKEGFVAGQKAQITWQGKLVGASLAFHRLRS